MLPLFQYRNETFIQFTVFPEINAPGAEFFEAKKTFQKPSVLCTPPFEKSPIKPHRFCVLPPLKNHPSNPISFMYSPL